MEKIETDNINTKSYWESRFSTGDWEEKGGRKQTSSFAASQNKHLRIPKNFDGVIVDFGCGLGDAIPVYHRYFPNAKLVGLDVSEVAIEKCKNYFGYIAQFKHGSYYDCPISDVIVASNVFEHLSEDINIARELLKKCRELYIIVPYKENPLCSEHLRIYDENYFREIGEYEYTIFPSLGWSEYGLSWIKLNINNILRKICGKKTNLRKMQIMFIFKSM